jgi:glucose-6-phosphate isomerase
MRSTKVLGEVKSLIHIGIGGSALGPALAIDALAREDAKVAVHVVSNIDGCALEAAMKQCDPATTLIASPPRPSPPPKP